ncbi:MAG: succinyldiaminopimelate transaminase [Spongiibacteraceae bacterium]|jgi:N-succinyldiaminopimelate aminotransferase|nr:succinyldiaminopimelate transaminase [Spongiibacteraceae bacterium]
MNSDLQKLQAYPFERLAELKAGITPPAELTHISLSIGEPKHPAPPFVQQALIENLQHLSTYPATRGLPELRLAIGDWATSRFQLSRLLDHEREVLPVNGTREALFAFAQLIVDRNSGADAPVVVCPNPFYQIYEGAAYLAGATPWFVDCTAGNGFLPDFETIPAAVWERCQLLFVCSPGNPTGAVMEQAAFERLIALADQYDFVIASDECYSELYFDEAHPPLGLLQVCDRIGRHDYRRCVVFHSLSKRSNVPGLRSGFVAGDAAIMERFLLYRTYHGCAMPLQHQLASVAAWRDEAHVRANRALYREKFMRVLDILDGALDTVLPAGGFYLWAGTPDDDRDFARRLFAEQHITVLPGQFLARETERGNPGYGRVRLALVATLEECVEAAQRIRHMVTA